MDENQERYACISYALADEDPRGEKTLLPKKEDFQKMKSG